MKMENQSTDNQEYIAAPDPSQVDWYDPGQVSEYYRQNGAYMQGIVARQVEAALRPYMAALQEAPRNWWVLQNAKAHPKNQRNRR